MKLGVDLFSIRSQGWSAYEYIDYCKKIGLDVVHFSDTEPFESLDEGYLKNVLAHAKGLGMEIEAGMGSICPTSNTFNDANGTAVEQVTTMLKVASILESPVLRCFLGSNADRFTCGGIQGHWQAVADTVEATKPLAMDLGIKFAIENHAGDMQGWELKELVERCGPDVMGVCIDAGNPLWVAEDPMVTLEHLWPYVVASHIRDTSVWSHPQGASVQWVAMGDGNVGIKKWCEAYIEKCPDTNFTMEIITGGSPRVMPFFKSEFWAGYPQAKASEFARFVKLAREGQPFGGPMITVGRSDSTPPEYAAALVAQQRVDLERSVTYCHEVLSVGESMPE